MDNGGTQTDRPKGNEIDDDETKSYPREMTDFTCQEKTEEESLPALTIM